MERHHFDKLNRLPPYILSEVIDLMKSARRAGEDIIDLGMGNPDLPTAPHVVEKICEAARDVRNHRYSASRGIPNLRAANCEWYERRHDVVLDPEQRLDLALRVTASSNELRELTVVLEKLETAEGER